MVREAGIELETIWAGGVVGKGVSGGLLGMMKIAAGVGQALTIMARFRPEATRLCRSL